VSLKFAIAVRRGPGQMIGPGPPNLNRDAKETASARQAHVDDRRTERPVNHMMACRCLWIDSVSFDFENKQ
jgi:hypothetical protein